MKLNKLFFFILLCFVKIVSSEPIKTDLYFCSAADEKYFDRLLNLIGSIHKTNFNNLKEIAVFDLGLNYDQLNKLKKIDKLKIYQVEKTNAQILTQFKTSNYNKMVPGWYAWKPVVIKQCLEMFPYVLWLDAGATVLKSLDELFLHIEQNGYVIVTIGDNITSGKFDHPVDWQTTRYLKQKFNLNLSHKKWILYEEAVTTCIIGVSKKNIKDFIMPMYELSYDLNNFKDDGSAPEGFGSARHDQSVLTLLAYTKGLNVSIQDYTQEFPIYLNVNKKEIPFWITWNNSFVSDKTHIYSSRVDINNLQHYLKCIKFKSGE